VTRAFLELAVRSFKNRITATVRRMRDPKYALGALFGAGYFAWIFLRNRHVSTVFKSGPMSELRTDVVSLVVLGLMLFAWAMPGDSGGLEFTEAEIQFLFPAPLRRRDLLLYKIIRAQPQVLTSVIIFSFLGATRGKVLGLWIAFSVMSVYMMLVALGRARLRLMGINFLVRLVGVLAIAAGLVALAVYVAHGIALHFERSNPTAMAQEIATAFHHPALRVVLFFPRAFAGAAFPASLTMLMISCAVLLPFGVVLFFAADRLNVSFEEGSLVRAQKRHDRLQQMQARRGGRYVLFKRARAPFRLAPTGRAETAIVWKNSVAVMRMSSPMLIIIPLIFAVLIGVAVAMPKSREGVTVTLLMWTVLLPFVGPNIFANDLRLDLPRLEVLKSYPLRGDGVVAAEIAAPLAIIAGLELLAIGCAWTTLGMSGKLSETTGAQFAICALLLAVPVVALQLLIRNAVPVIFPAWASRSKEDPRGFVLTGQRILLVIGNLFVLGIALMPAGLVFAASAVIATKFFSGNIVSMAVMTTPAIAVIAGEVWLGVRFLGSRFDELDVSEEFDTVAV
jgi:hypothetical protein